MLEAQNAGKYAPRLCAADGGFQLAYSACEDCFGDPGSVQQEILDYYMQFVDFCTAKAATSSTVFASSPASTSSTVFESATQLTSSFPNTLATPSVVPSTTSSSAVSISIETLTTSVLTTRIVTTVQAGTTATLTAPGATVYESLSLTVMTVQSRITSLTVCASLTVNPTYTITGTIPTDWTWGCPPGTVCSPVKVDCNYEVLPGLLEDNYYCSPDECIPVSALPSATPTTVPFPFVPGYLNLHPSDFGLSLNQVFAVETVSTSTKIFKSTASASHTTSPPTHTTSPSHKASAGVIAGSTVGGVAGLALFIALFSFLLLRRRHQRKQAALAAAAPPPDEKAQLHSDDIRKAELHSEDVQPIRTELEGGIKRKPVPPREMAANEEANRVSELPANEVVGSEMESSAGKSLGTSSATRVSGS